jgi:hypothetical protein
MAFLKRTTAPFRVPSLTDADAEYASVLTLKHDLDSRRAAVETELRDIAKGKIPAALVEQTTAARRARAVELLGDLAPANGDIHLRPSNADVQARAEELRAEAGAIDAALGVIVSKLASAKAAAERAVCDATRDAYYGAYRELAKALAAAQRAHRVAISIRDDLDVEGVQHAGHLPVPSAIPMLGNPFERNVKLDRWLQEAVTAGLIKSEETN